jgi:hypothetical protein
MSRIMTALVFMLFATSSSSLAQDSRDTPIELVRVRQPIVVDGVMNDEGWRDAPVLPAVMYTPVFKGQPTQRTEMRAVMQPTGGRRSRLKSGWLWMDSMIIDRSARSWSALSESFLAGSLLVPLKGRIVCARRFPEHCRTSPGNPPRPRATALTKAFSCSRVLGRGVGIPVRAIREEIPVDPIQPHDDHSRMGSSIASSAIAQVLRHVEASPTA